MARNSNIEDTTGKPVISGLTFDEAKERGLLDADPIKSEVMGMDYNEAVASGILDAVEMADEGDERRRPAWMTAIGI